MLGRILHRLRRAVRLRFEPRPETLLALRPPLSLPDGISADALRAWLRTVHPAGAPAQEMANYCGEDFERFVRTWHLAAGLTGECLEIGANPYFTTMLLRRFSPLRLTLVNYFGPKVQDSVLTQEVCFENWQTGQPDRLALPTHHFNIEKERFPFSDGAFDVVLFCEVLEHLLEDPFFTLREIQRVLKPGGTLIVTTPNVIRLENVARLLAGENIYDPYSGYGPYGRHNREYTLKELRLLLEHAGFIVDTAISADVHENRANLFFPVSKLAPLVQRNADLGQYLFVKAKNQGKVIRTRPGWLFRSYPAHDEGKEMKNEERRIRNEELA
jgi:SAM-dependent methyltransferase